MSWINMKRPSSSSYFHQHQHHFFLIPQTLRLVQVLQPPLDIRVYLVAAFSPIGVCRSTGFASHFLPSVMPHQLQPSINGT